MRFLHCAAHLPFARYLILDILGQGTFGQVVKCQNMKTHEIVAVKVIKNKPAYFNQSMMEVTILEMVSSRSCSLQRRRWQLRERLKDVHSFDAAPSAQSKLGSERRASHPPTTGYVHPLQASLPRL